MEWKVAPSYKNATIAKVDEENRKAYIVERCDRCGGTGTYIIPGIFAGTCFKCNGMGKTAKWVKAYSEVEYEKYLASYERTKERKAEKEAARKQNLLDNSEANKINALAELGYNPKNPEVYLVVGDNTYAIKDELKAAGCRFERALGWYNTHEIEIPADYSLTTVAFDDIFDWNPLTKRFSLKEDAKEKADAAINAAMPESLSEYVGEVKERLRDLHATLTDSRQIDGYYGTSTIYTFKVGENVFIWLTSSYHDIQIGDNIILTGTIKDHKEYRGVKQTVLSRCIVKKEGV